jgi:hypothetical protein
MMEGPTPISAVTAATMVAGESTAAPDFLPASCWQRPRERRRVAWCHASRALAVVALCRQRCRYSTISQLGYMVVGMHARRDGDASFTRVFKALYSSRLRIHSRRALE